MLRRNGGCRSVNMGTWRVVEGGQREPMHVCGCGDDVVGKPDAGMAAPISTHEFPCPPGDEFGDGLYPQ